MQNMNVGQVLMCYYQKLIKDDSVIYSVDNIRDKVSSDAALLLQVLDEKNKQGVCFDDKIFSFLNFLNGYDTPEYDNDEYLYNIEDLKREFVLLGNLDNIKGGDVEV
jgi:hypothetical protein